MYFLPFNLFCSLLMFVKFRAKLSANNKIKINGQNTRGQNWKSYQLSYGVTILFSFMDGVWFRWNAILVVNTEILIQSRFLITFLLFYLINTMCKSSLKEQRKLLQNRKARPNLFSACLGKNEGNYLHLFCFISYAL